MAQRGPGDGSQGPAVCCRWIRRERREFPPPVPGFHPKTSQPGWDVPGVLSGQSLNEAVYPDEVRGDAVRQLAVVLAACERPVRLASSEGREPLDIALEFHGLGPWVSPHELRHSIGEFFQVVYLSVAGGPGGYVRLQPVLQRRLRGAQDREVVGVCVDQCLHRAVPAVGVRHPVSGFPGLLVVIGFELLSAFPSVLALGSGHEDSLPRCAGCRVVDGMSALQFILAGGHRH